MDDIYQDILEDFEAYCCCDDELSKKCLKNKKVIQLEDKFKNQLSEKNKKTYEQLKKELNKSQYNFCIELVKYTSIKLHSLYKEILK